MIYFILVELPPKMINDLLIQMADIEYRLSIGKYENVQLSALIAAFHSVRKLSIEEEHDLMN